MVGRATDTRGWSGNYMRGELHSLSPSTLGYICEDQKKKKKRGNQGEFPEGISDFLLVRVEWDNIPMEHSYPTCRLGWRGREPESQGDRKRGTV